VHPEQKKIYESMSAEEKIQIALRLYYSARQLKLAALRDQNPDWTEREIQDQLMQIFLYAGT
jgi:hypothetical protein